MEDCMSSEAWVQLALNKLACTQKELALRLAVSPTQITKWKNGEHISFAMEDRFRELTGIGSKFPDFVIWAGTDRDAESWQSLILELASIASMSCETGYVTGPLEDEPELLCWNTFYTLREMGISIPKRFPEKLAKILNQNVDDADVDVDDLLSDEYAALILRMFKALNDVYGFFVAYIQELTDDDELDILETGMEMESGLLSLAASKIDVPPHMSSTFNKFRYQTKKMYEEWIQIVKNAAVKAGAPLRAELNNFIDENHDGLGHEAEAESLGFNSRREHPDIYMNELLIGMRELRTAIPAIAGKLGISLNMQLEE
jgi:hypothetical protein